MASTTDLCLVPAVPPPSGVSNFVDPPSLAPVIVSVLSIMVVWASIFTVVRVYNNFRELKFGDYAVVAAACMSIAYCGVLFTQQRTFRHNWDIPACWYDGDFVKGIFICSLLYHLGCFFAKTSIFLLFFQVFKVQRPMRYAIWAGMIFNFAIYTVGTVVAIYYDVPHIGETWMDALESGRMLIPIRWVQLESGLIVLLDLYIFILPLPAISKLKMGIRQRISVMAVFSLALLGIGASIASLVERIPIEHVLDQTWVAAILCLCSAVELNVAIIVSCGPAFAAAMRKLPSLPTLSSVRSLLSRTDTSATNLSRSQPSDMTEIYSKASKDRGTMTTTSTSTTTDDLERHPLEYGRPRYARSDNWRTDSDVTIYENVDAPKDSGILCTRTVDQEVITVSMDEAESKQPQTYLLRS